MKISTLILALLCAMALIPQAADATTIETFSFTQLYPVHDPADILNGTFSGIPEADGSIRLADLTSLIATFTFILGPTGNENDTFGLADLNLFSFFPSSDGPNSSLDLFAGGTRTPGSICVGAAAAFGLCGLGGNVAGVDNLKFAPLLFTTTTQLPVVTFVPPQPAATPEPASLILTGLAIAFLLVARRVASVRTNQTRIRRAASSRFSSEFA